MKTGMLIVVVMVSVWCAGCAQSGYQVIKPAEYADTHQMFDLTFGWKKTVTEHGLTIDGYVRNNRYFIISDMDMTVSVLDSSGREKSREDFLFIPSRLPMDNFARFSVALKARPQAGDKIRFLYRYDALDGKDGALTWRNSFEVPVAE